MADYRPKGVELEYIRPGGIKTDGGCCAKAERGGSFNPPGRPSGASEDQCIFQCGKFEDIIPERKLSTKDKWK